jgi:tetratricopeptide (TPR) repeat protein
LTQSGGEAVLVGREHELEKLEAALDDALAGRGRLCLIGGESGVGKSRLVDELGSRAKDREARVLWGRCWEAGGAPPYWPWVQAIRSFVRGQDTEALLSQLGSGAADVAQIIPELRDLFPELRVPPSSDPEGARFRLFDSTTSFLRSVARGQPLVLLLDDLHAADAPSLLLLQFVASELGDARVLLVAAYRDDGPEHAGLASTLAELGRQQMTRQIPLSGLDQTNVARLIESTLDVPPPAALIAAVHKETGGNPLLVGELVRLFAAEGDLAGTGGRFPFRITAAPRIREVISRRLALLSAPCLRVLTLAAVLGREFRFDALAKASGVSAGTLLEVIDEGVRARVVAEVPGAIGRMHFSHALVREALYDGLSTARRVQFHREIGEMLEGLYAEDPEPHLAELAHHFCQGARAGDVDKAVSYAWRAGEQAAAVLAYEEGVRLFRVALDVLEMMDPGDEEARCRLLLTLGDAQARAGDLAGAKESFLRAADVARKRNMPEQLAAAILGYGGRFVWARAGSDRRLVPLLEEALSSLTEEDSRIRAQLMARLAGALREQRSPDRQDRLSRQAVEMARRIGDPATLSYALEGRVAATWWPDNAEERLAIATEILDIAGQAGDAERVTQGRDWRMLALMELGNVTAVDAELEAMSVVVEELRQPAQRWLVWSTRAMRALFDGRFDEAERLITEALTIGEGALGWDAVFGFKIQMYFLRREQGRLEEMEQAISRSIAAYPTRHVFRCLQVHLYSELGRTVESRRAFEELAVDDFAELHRDNDWLFEMSLLPEITDLLGDVRRAATLHDLLSPYAARSVPTGGEVSTGSISRCIGILASTLRRWDEAAARFGEALELNAAMGARPWVAYTQYDFARMLLARDAAGDREQATELLAGAAETTEVLGMRALRRKVARVLEIEGVSSGRPTTGDDLSVEERRRVNVFRREGDYWSIRFERDAFRLKDSKGLRYLARLLGSPAREVLALELMAAGHASASTPGSRAVRREGVTDLHLSGGGAGEILDPRARDAYRRRLEELQGDLDEAEPLADLERAARAREEMDFLARELAGAVGLGGRSRRTPSDAERARVNVTKAIKAALARIGEQSPALGHHLATTIRTGTFCSYRPDPRVPMTWQV